jgi:hypothetical protein
MACLFISNREAPTSGRVPVPPRYSFDDERVLDMSDDQHSSALPYGRVAPAGPVVLPNLRHAAAASPDPAYPQTGDFIHKNRAMGSSPLSRSRS